MIVTYTTTLRGGNGESTIVVPDVAFDNEEDFLSYIKLKCAEHYDSKQTNPYYHIQDPQRLLILMISK